MAPSSSPPPPPSPEVWPRKRALRILCFGDSLTAGYSGLGSSYNPYAERLAARLEKAFPNLRLETEVDGAPGDLVYAPMGKFVSRMESHFDPDEEATATPPYDWVIVLGGTNDLAFSIDVEKVFEAMRTVWEMPLRRGCKVLAMTVPEAGVKGSARERARLKREKLNDMIRGHKAKNL